MITKKRRTLRIEKLKARMKQRCMKCEEESGKKSVDVCFNCAFHCLINIMYKEILNGH